MKFILGLAAALCLLALPSKAATALDHPPGITATASLDHAIPDGRVAVEQAIAQRESAPVAPIESLASMSELSAANYGDHMVKTVDSYSDGDRCGDGFYLTNMVKERSLLFGSNSYFVPRVPHRHRSLSPARVISPRAAYDVGKSLAS